MDKKQLLGLLVIGVILFGFSWYNSIEAEKFQAQKAKEDSIALANMPAVEKIEQTNIKLQLDSLSADTSPEAQAQIQGDSSQIKAKENFIGAELYAASVATAETFVVENELAKYTFSTKGGKIVGVELKKYTRYDGKPLQMFDPETVKFDLSFFIKRQYNNLELNTAEYVFTSTKSASGDAQVVTMKLPVSEAGYLEYVYTIAKDNYMVDMNVNFVNMANVLANQSDFTILWSNESYQNEKGFKNENNYTTIDYNFPGVKSIEELGMSTEKKSETINNRVKWFAFKQQFFSSVFIAQESFQNADLGFNTYSATSDKIKLFDSKASVAFNPAVSNYKFQFYFGPNKYSTLKKYDLHLEKLVPMGGWVIGWVNQWIVIPVFDFLGKYIMNYGLIILILTIIIKIIIAPLTYKSYLSTAKMRLLKPEMDEIAAKYPKQDEAMKKQQAIMELYKRAGVSPMGGCIPMLIQFPILIAMFRFFPASIELRGEHFLWADDLSSYDSILNLPFDIPFYGSHVSLFALLMAVSVYISSKINYTQTAAAGPQMAGMKFMMLYMMPVMLLFWFNDYSSGLSYYYLVSNVITIGQTYAFRYAVSDEKLHKQMKANAKKPAKKSKWAERLEQMQKSQQQQLKNRK